MNGWAGAGAFSDGKLSLSEEVGGNLTDYLPVETVRNLIHYADEMYLHFGAPVSYTHLKQYSHDIVANASALADGLLKRGVKLVSGGTDNHLSLIHISLSVLKRPKLRDHGTDFFPVFAAICFNTAGKIDAGRLNRLYCLGEVIDRQSTREKKGLLRVGPSYGIPIGYLSTSSVDSGGKAVQQE